MATLTKLIDTQFGNNHPNGINVGHTAVAESRDVPIVGQPFQLGTLKTSIVTEILHETEKEITFETMNSVYRLTY